MTAQRLKADQFEIERLVREMSDEADPGEARMIELIDAVMAHIASEETVVFPALAHTGIELQRHRASHASAKLALFRVATSGGNVDVYRASVRALGDTLRAHAAHEAELVARLEALSDDARLVGLDERLAAFRAKLLVGTRGSDDAPRAPRAPSPPGE